MGQLVGEVMPGSERPKQKKTVGEFVIHDMLQRLVNMSTAAQFLSSESVWYQNATISFSLCCLLLFICCFWLLLFPVLMMIFVMFTAVQWFLLFVVPFSCVVICSFHHVIIICIVAVHWLLLAAFCIVFLYLCSCFIAFLFVVTVHWVIIIYCFHLSCFVVMLLFFLLVTFWHLLLCCDFCLFAWHRIRLQTWSEKRSTAFASISRKLRFSGFKQERREAWEKAAACIVRDFRHSCSCIQTCCMFVKQEFLQRNVRDCKIILNLLQFVISEPPKQHGNSPNFFTFIWHPASFQYVFSKQQ